MAGLNWDKARQRDLVRDRGGVKVAPQPKPKPRGISNDQAKRLAKLRRAQGLLYDGNGMTYGQASRAIREATDALRARTVPSPDVRERNRAQYAAQRQARLRAAFRARQERAM
jgi:hypothetical protein